MSHREQTVDEFSRSLPNKAVSFDSPEKILKIMKMPQSELVNRSFGKNEKS